VSVFPQGQNATYYNIEDTSLREDVEILNALNLIEWTFYAENLPVEQSFARLCFLKKIKKSYNARSLWCINNV